MNKLHHSFLKSFLAFIVLLSLGPMNILSVNAESETSLPLSSGSQIGGVLQSAKADAAVAKGSLGFFQYNASLGDESYGETVLNKGIELATALVAQGSYSYTKRNQTVTDKVDKDIITNIGAEDDATSLVNFAEALNLLRECNQLRASDNNFSGLQPYLVADSFMASAEVNANVNTEVHYHWQGNGSMLDYLALGENVAWGYQDPFDGWYTDEKAEYDNKTGNVTGHYTNICSSSTIASGIGGIRNTYGWDVCDQDFAYSFSAKNLTGKMYTIDEYVNRFIDYLKANEIQYSYNAATGEISLLQPANEMFRMYNPNSGEHFYTSSNEERSMLRNAGWRYEGVGWYAPVSSNTPVYRLYNPNAGDHHYTTNANEKDSLVNAGWLYEGIGWYSDEWSDAVPLYRQYNPNAVSGAHNYTVNSGERDMLVGVGWHDEGISWYGCTRYKVVNG